MDAHDGDGLTFTSAYSPSPIDNAATRYSDFCYHIRAVGDPVYMAFGPAKIEPTKDRSILVTFEVKLPSVKVNQLYEAFFSYKVDGREEISESPPNVLRGDVAKGKPPGATPAR